MNEVNDNFRPEFLNRIDEIVVFHPLQKEQMIAITRIQIDHQRKRLREQEIELEISDNVLDYLGKQSFDPVYGARPLKRTIQDKLESPIAEQILAEKFTPGTQIKSSLNGNKLEFSNQLYHS